MNKIRFLLTFLVCGYISFGQNSGEVSYNVSLNQQTLKDKKPDKKVRDMIANAEDVEFKLTFSKTESLYQKEKSLENDASKNSLNIVEIFAGSNNIVYFNSEDKQQIDQISVGKEKFLVKKNPLEWKITKESKLIEKYNCLKAILLDNNNDETKTIAWFTLEIPVNFGPNFYNNLPGLVIRVEDNMLIYSAETIKISKKNKTIGKPSEGELITYKEFKERFSGFLNED